MKAERREVRFGQICGLAIALVGIIGPVMAVIVRPTLQTAVAGVLISGGALASIVVAFLKGQRATEPENSDAAQGVGEKSPPTDEPRP